MARYAEWSRPFSPDNARPGVLAFNGDVYDGLDARTLTEAQLDYAQRHLRILRAHLGLAIDSARAAHEHERLACLSNAAGELKSLRTQLAAPSLFESPLPPALACPGAQSVVHRARRCR